MNINKDDNFNKITKEMLENKAKIAPQWKIFPFVINNGAIGLSETGYKPVNSKITDFGKYELIITGDTPVVVVWKNSTVIYQKNKGTTDPKTKITTGQDQFYTKKYQVGDYWEGVLIEDISGVDFSTLVSNTIYKTITTKRSYKLVLTTQKLTVNDYLQFFVVFNNNSENIGGDSVQDRQLLYLSEVVNSYDKDTGNFVAQTLTLSSLNDKLQSSGQTTLGFIQYASPGSGYAFPVVNNGVVSLNRELMRDIGVTFAHRQSYGMELLSSCYYYGRPIIQGQKPTQIDDKEIFEQKLYASRRLFIAGNNDYSTTDVKNNGGLFAGLNDAITTSSHPETTFYNIMDAQPTGYENFKDWKDWISSSIGILPDAAVKKDFKGVLKFDNKQAIASNGTKIEEAKAFWDSLWNIENISGNYNVEMSSYYKFKNPEDQTIVGSPAFDYSKIKQKFMSSILNFNGTIFSHLLQMPYDSKQWVPFAFSNIPVIGKYLNQLNLGIPFGFILGQSSKQYQKMPQFNGFMSAFFANALSNIVGKDGLIPLNLFSNNSESEIGKILGSNVSTTALLMKLTDRISVYPWTLDGKKTTTPEQISTVNLSQKYNNKVYIMSEDTEFLDTSSPLTNKDNDCQWNPTADGIAPGAKYGYIIDYIVTQSLHQGEERHTFYNDNPIANNINDFNELSVAQYRFNNSASFTSNMFNWTTQYKTNHDEYEETEQTTFSYPSSVLPPDPMNLAKPIIIIPEKPTVDITLNKIPTLLKAKTDYDIDYIDTEWKNNNLPLIKPLEITINFNDYLDPSFFIKSFSDFKRYYKSLDIYLSWDYTTEEWRPTNSEVNTSQKTSEEFKPTKSLDWTFTHDLNSLLTYSENIQLNFYNEHNKKSIPAFPQYYEVGASKTGIIPSNINNLYNMDGLQVTLNANDSDISTSYINRTYLGFNDISNDSFKMKIQYFPMVSQVEVAIGTPTTYYYDLNRQITNYKLTISKIVFNPR